MDGEINNQFNQTQYNFQVVADGAIPPNITFDGPHPRRTGEQRAPGCSRSIASWESRYW